MIRYILCRINRLFVLCFEKGIQFQTNSILLFTTIKNRGQGGKIKLENSYINNSSITSEGIDNNIIIHGEIRNSNIFVSGNNNELHIKNNTSIMKLKLVIRGNNCNITIKENTTFGSGYLICMGDRNFIEIGKDCQIADDVSIWATDSHPIYDEDGNICNASKPIRIYDHVWIGNKSIVLKGVEIGKNSVIGMGSVVTGAVDAHSVYAGNPAKKIKTISNWDRTFITI